MVLLAKAGESVPVLTVRLDNVAALKPLDGPCDVPPHYGHNACAAADMTVALEATPDSSTAGMSGETAIVAADGSTSRFTRSS